MRSAPVLVSLGLRSLTLALSSAAVFLPASAQSPAPRPGVTASFVQIGSAGGIDGRAYLPATPTWVTVGASECGTRVEMTAKANTGHVREIRVTVELASTGTVSLRASGCPRAQLGATLEDGTTLTGESGSVTVQTFDAAASPVLTGLFAWSPLRGGQPMPFRGMLAVPRPGG